MSVRKYSKFTSRDGKVSFVLCTQEDTIHVLDIEREHAKVNIVSECRFPYECYGRVTALTWLEIDRLVVCLGTDSGHLLILSGTPLSHFSVLQTWTLMPPFLELKQAHEKGVLISLGVTGRLTFMSISPVLSGYRHECPYKLKESREQPLESTSSGNIQSTYRKPLFKLLHVANPYCVVGSLLGAIGVLNIVGLATRWQHNIRTDFMSLEIVYPDGTESEQPCSNLLVTGCAVHLDRFNAYGPVLSIAGVESSSGVCSHILWICARGRLCVIKRREEVSALAGSVLNITAGNTRKWHFWSYDFKDQPIPTDLLPAPNASVVCLMMDGAAARFEWLDAVRHPKNMDRTSDTHLFSVTSSGTSGDEKENTPRLPAAKRKRKEALMWTLGNDGHVCGWRLD